jgi:hypothetical protein
MGEKNCWFDQMDTLELVEHWLVLSGAFTVSYLLSD